MNATVNARRLRDHNAAKARTRTVAPKNAPGAVVNFSGHATGMARPSRSGFSPAEAARFSWTSRG